MLALKSSDTIDLGAEQVKLLRSVLRLYLDEREPRSMLDLRSDESVVVVVPVRHRSLFKALREALLRNPIRLPWLVELKLVLRS